VIELPTGAHDRFPGERGRGWYGWQVWVGVLVGLGCLATAGYAVIETFWG
jgi:hypothetical protein